MKKRSVDLTFDRHRGFINFSDISDLDMDLDTIKAVKDYLNVHFKIPFWYGRSLEFLWFVPLVLAMICLPAVIVYNMKYFPLGFPFLPLGLLLLYSAFFYQKCLAENTRNLPGKHIFKVDEVSHGKLRLTLYFQTGKIKLITKGNIKVV